MPEATEDRAAATPLACPYHDTPLRCSVCGATCHGGAKGVRCRIDHDDQKHTPVVREPVQLDPPQWHDDDNDAPRHGLSQAGPVVREVARRWYEDKDED